MGKRRNLLYGLKRKDNLCRKKTAFFVEMGKSEAFPPRFLWSTLHKKMKPSPAMMLSSIKKDTVCKLLITVLWIFMIRSCSYRHFPW